ncbi:hypothetical protein PF005_g26373 [Phytophthora fragariae]|uniref:Uncharacterized protein n=1 Tax=Phytophthora fragariae TaxID=53985 RepID=A0A6A3HUY2_9STRA|nr:hypothetical protein PF003_g6869 [Phytophthora fragariae]KAE8922724.1 hypothetical protein PF009_g27015 [Phytophthora fragariae]KAE8973501.1 hypothetical protein PF011_g25226 [Phytophthora fragariae]KAE9089582.1 hypothetical protein PF006_g25332 [Phytophthora fragariae]KAE9173190.1 hypothetical protein PF005_g26373 [Phytophthora fragariae]
MAFVCGDPKGYREVVILSVDDTAGASTAIKLDTGDIIAPTITLKRLIARSGQRIAQVMGLWRKLRTYRLVAGAHEAPTRSSVFNRAMQEAVRQAFATAYRTEHAPREEMSCVDSGEIVASSTMAAAPPSNDVPVSSAPTSCGMSPPGSAAGTTSHDPRIRSLPKPTSRQPRYPLAPETQ